MAAAIAGCDPVPKIQISSDHAIGNNRETYFDCKTDQICHVNDTSIIAGRVVTGSRKESCNLASDDEISKYQAMCRKRYPDKSPD